MKAHRRIASLVGGSIGWIARIAPVMLPRRVLTTRELVVLHHPRPLSPGHLLILPRHCISGLDGPVRATAETIQAMLDVLRRLANVCFDRPEDVIAVINGGARQDVRLLHMHLLVDSALADGLRAAESAMQPSRTRQMATSRPLQPVHLLYHRGARDLVAVVVDFRRVSDEQQLARSGYSLMTRAAEPMVLHLVGNGSLDGGHVGASIDDYAARITP